MTPCTDKKHQAMKDDGYAKCWDCGESFYAERKPSVVAPTELLAVLIDLCEAIDAYQSAREELQKCEDGSLDEQEAIDFALGQWKTVLELRKAVSANPTVDPRPTGKGENT